MLRYSLKMARPLWNVRSLSATTSAATRNYSSSGEDVYNIVQDYYGKVLASTKDLKTSACIASARPHPVILKALKGVPQPITERYYGCGSPLPLGIEGLNVLDLGSGSGQDCYLAADLVGEKGSVTGVDMTDEQLELARSQIAEYTKKLGYNSPNLKFVKGYIEFLEKAGIEPNSMDMVISNCVINLSPNKHQVLAEVYRVLKEGGEFYFSDVYCDRRIPKKLVSHPVLLGECLSGALYIEDFKRICHQVGFADPRIVSQNEITVGDPELSELLGNCRFSSVTYRLFKLPSLETLCEDFGQYAMYNGKVFGHSHSYKLDDHHVCITNKPMLVCGNTASMLQETWLSKYFTVHGDRSVHYGLFDCSPGGSGGSSGVGHPGTAVAPASSCGPSSCGPSSGGGGCC